MLYNNPFKNDFDHRWWRVDSHITYFFRCIKHRLHRAKYGWAECDTWNMCDYLLEVLPDMLDFLAENHEGTPVFGTCNSHSINVDDTDMDAADTNWTTVLKTMATYFREAREENTGENWTEYSKFSGASFKKAIEAKDISEIVPYNKEDWDKIGGWTSRNQKYMKENLDNGLAMLKEHFYDLWD